MPGAEYARWNNLRMSQQVIDISQPSNDVDGDISSAMLSTAPLWGFTVGVLPMMVDTSLMIIRALRPWRSDSRPNAMAPARATRRSCCGSQTLARSKRGKCQGCG